MMGARETALNALIACRKDGAWSNAVLKEYVRRDRLDSRDAALAARLCYGVLQNRQKLDFYVTQLLTGRLKDLHPVVRDILHLGLYQIYELDKIPDSAAVNESVALAKKYCKNPKAGGLVNGVLRSAVRTRGHLQEPVSYADRYSHPDALISLLKANLPKGKLEPMLIADNEAPQTTVQVNTLRTTMSELVEILEQEHVTVRPHGWMENCLVLSGTGSIESLPSFQKGLYYVQDPAAKLSVQCAGLPKEDIRVLDCCSAPGGKSFAAAIAMAGRGRITSCDVHAHKTGLIENGAARLGLNNITVRLQDATRFVPEWENAMDVVIADVPCSGLGIIRKKPDIRYKNLAELKELPALQKKILENQSRYVKPGGVLLYSTCTVLKAENEEIVADFLEKHEDFYREPLELPGVFPKNETGMLTLIPGDYDTDGFFICRLRRKA
ncbi:MAG: 16S rRNA (cytosine(967)-C(5))-methyltransferase RsmB [Oscillospiraceae bacterium]|nr:16S rRNA (cytosine(967)-C(5))-methyltransferase RsmB [Oscillospiraceae bacterium]